MSFRPSKASGEIKKNRTMNPKHIIIASISLLLAAACEEFQPVFTTPQNPPIQDPVTGLKANTTIAQLKQMYKDNDSKPITITKSCIISGQVTTSDRVGNVYKSVYIQDETAGIEIKIGKNGLYNEYKLGQTLYVDCNGLTVGNYNGMIQVGYADPTGEYETSYLEHPYIIDAHVYKGPEGEPVKPRVIRKADSLKVKENLGRLVTIRDLTYANEIFCLIYVNPNLSGEAKKAATNRIFLSSDSNESPKTYGITTWAMSKSLFKWHLDRGDFDEADLQDGSKTVAQLKAEGVKIQPTAYSVSQYFKMGSQEVQVRSSGFARFSDDEIDADVRAGRKKVDFTGILSDYQGSPQFTLIDLDGVNIHD